MFDGNFSRNLPTTAISPFCNNASQESLSKMKQLPDMRMNLVRFKILMKKLLRNLMDEWGRSGEDFK
jgi:hypothetical protein